MKSVQNQRRPVSEGFPYSHFQEKREAETRREIAHQNLVQAILEANRPKKADRLKKVK
jgi:hypothetical protein